MAQKGKTPSGADRLIPVQLKDQKFHADQSRYIWTYDVTGWTNTVLGKPKLKRRASLVLVC